MGCWVRYGLGGMNDNLPTFVVLPDHRGFASNGPKNWDAAFLPARHQGTAVFPGRAPPGPAPARAPPLAPPAPPPPAFCPPAAGAEGLPLRGRLTRSPPAGHAGAPRLE